MDNISDYLTSIQQEVVAEQKTVKVARLIILLIKIEKELNAVKSTLVKLHNHQQDYKKDSPLAGQIKRKLDAVNELLEKIRKARLNLNFYFI